MVYQNVANPFKSTKMTKYISVSAVFVLQKPRDSTEWTEHS